MAQKPISETQLVTAITEAASLDKTATGGAVTLPGLGKFACRDRPEREVRNPLTGEKTIKPADRSAKVTISRQLKDVLDG